MVLKWAKTKICTFLVSLSFCSTEKIFETKINDAAWFVSQCDRQSRRGEYVKLMTSEISVHIYGKCGNYTCGSKGYAMGGNKTQCLNLLSRDYM